MTEESYLRKLPGQYLAALKCHIAQASEAGMPAARELGRTAVATGLEILDLARIHEHALASLLLPGYSSGARDNLTRRAADFFTEAITPIEETHSAARKANADLNQLNTTLDKRSLDLADSNRELQHQVAGRTTAEAALRDSEAAFSLLLKDSRELERHLQEMAHRILVTTEAERKKMSHQLNDEIAQTLLAINLRLLALKKEIAISHDNLNREIATTCNLVETSVNLITRLANEFNS